MESKRPMADRRTSGTGLGHRARFGGFVFGPFLKEHVAFRGGTALHKIYLKPQARYSEDIDLIQIKKGPIKPILQAIGKQLDFLGTKRNIKQNVNMNTATYRFESEIPPVVNMRLKIEINTREHFTVMGYTELEHSMENGWFS